MGTTLTAEDTAAYFLALVEEDEGELMSHLKLQKLCYYAQGFHLAITGYPLFTDRIEAWTHMAPSSLPSGSATSSTRMARSRRSRSTSRSTRRPPAKSSTRSTRCTASSPRGN